MLLVQLVFLCWDGQAFSVGANQGIVVYIPKVLATADTTEVIQQKGIHIVADNLSLPGLLMMKMLLLMRLTFCLL